MFSRKNDDSENFLHRIHVKNSFFSTRKFRFSFYQNDSNRFFRKSHPEPNTSFFGMNGPISSLFFIKRK
ncbi:hypothetical protein LEP1GSC187_4094 [Leptospira santarosai str. ZUN179]|uniref:Uncharacterized protein n=1 Tax=Leptospira santarosai str. ZUN179 TaxID=1049985 RepID=M6VBR4_9LEPT|nr:hypothetical protein LEP1GSC187_4094 [Leptospira santarosai str. ZUN179]